MGLLSAEYTDHVADIDLFAKMQASRLSLMPEGLEEGLTPENMADLLDYIISDLH